VLVGHYPVYSIGEHGDTVVLQGALKTLLDFYEVDAYICGHDHTLQHLTKGKVEYYVSGNGGKIGSLPKTTSATVNFAKVDPGFMIHEVNEWNMTVKVIDSSGALIYNFTQARNFRISNGGRPAPYIPDFDDDKDDSVSITSKVVMGILISVCALVALFFLRRHFLHKKAAEQARSPSPGGSTVPLGMMGRKKQTGAVFEDPDDLDLEDEFAGHPTR
jgi:hypothetical protein